MCAAANRCTSGLVALTAVSMSEWLGDAGLFFWYATFGVGAMIFYCRVVPETSGKTLEELAADRAEAEGMIGSEEDENNMQLVEAPHGTFT